MARRPNIGRLRRRGDVEGLRAARDYRDYTRTREGDVLEIGAPTREAAVEVLGELDAPEALDGLCTATNDPEPRVRAAAVATPSQPGEPKAVEALATALVGWPADDPAGIDAVWTALAGMNQLTGVAPL